MTKFKKWSEQSLHEETFRYEDEHGEWISEKKNVLQVCIAGKELFRKEFKEGKYKDSEKLSMPFDFILTAGAYCPKGKFYEMEYTIGEYGAVYRGLIQAVDPVTDISLIVGLLKHKNYLPKDIRPMKAWLREDIDAVSVGSCSRDADGVSFWSGRVDACEGAESVLDYAVRNDVTFDYYRGDCVEVWLHTYEKFDCEPIFVCGSENVGDEAFSKQRAEDMARLGELLDEVETLVDDYNLSHFIMVESGNDENGTNYRMHLNIQEEDMRKVVEAVYKN